MLVWYVFILIIAFISYAKNVEHYSIIVWVLIAEMALITSKIFKNDRVIESTKHIESKYG